MRKRMVNLISAMLCLCFLFVSIPTSATAAPLYSGNWKDGKWSVQGASVSAEGDEVVVSGSANAVISTLDSYNLGDCFTWSVDYAITNNYNCNEKNYTEIAVGDLRLRISSMLNHLAGGRNESFTSNKPYVTGFRLYWNDKELTADYSQNCFFTTAYISYKLEYNKGNVTVIRKSSEDERAVLRVSAATLKGAAGALPQFNGIGVVITDRESHKTTKLRNFTLESGVSGTEYLNHARLVGKSSMGDVNGNGLFSQMDLLLSQQVIIGDASVDTLVMATADSDGNKKFDSADALTVYQMLEQVKKYDGPTASKFVALTFDDGPSYDTTTRLLELSDRYNVPFTFFVVGKNIEANSYNLVKAKELGCEIGSHSWSHANFKNLYADGEDEKILAEISDTNAAIKGATGQDTRLFRFPLVYEGYPIYGFKKYDFGMNYICGKFVGINSDDTIKSRTDSLKKLYPNDGYIILMHDSGGNYRTIEAVEECLPLMMEQGVEPVTVSQLALLKGKIMDKGNTLYSKF